MNPGDKQTNYFGSVEFFINKFDWVTIMRLNFKRSKGFLIQEVDKTIMRLKVRFFMKSKVAIIFEVFDYEINRFLPIFHEIVCCNSEIN
jgi:hypothetical protein